MLVRNVIVTGFEPYADFAKNSSEEVVRELNGRMINGHNIVGFTIPYDSRNIQQNLIDKIQGIGAQRVIMLGESFDVECDRIVLERMAKNYVDYENDGLHDNTGYRPPKGQIVECSLQHQYFAPTEFLIYAGMLPFYQVHNIDEIVKGLTKTDIAHSVSYDCGTNFCNETFFHLLRKYNLQTKSRNFIHIPSYEGNFDKDAIVFAVQNVIDILTKPTLVQKYRNWKNGRQTQKDMKKLRVHLKDRLVLEQADIEKMVLQEAVKRGGTSELLRNDVLVRRISRGHYLQFIPKAHK